MISSIKACSSEMLPSLLSWENPSRTSESGGSLSEAPWARFRTMPGFAGPAGFFSSTDEVEGASERLSLTESTSSRVGGRPRSREDNRVRTCLEGAEGSPARGLLDAGIFSGLVEANQ